MGIHWEREKFSSATVDDKRALVVETLYLLDSANDVDEFVHTRKKKGGVVVRRHGSRWYYYSIDSLSYSRWEPEPGGVLHIVETMTLTTYKRADKPVPPWELSPTNYQQSGATLDESTAFFYPGAGDPIFPGGTGGESRPFVNTAGVMLEGVATRNLLSFSFSYNLANSEFRADAWRAKGKINASKITVAGRTFAPRELKLEDVKATPCRTSTETLDANGAVTEITWKFWKIDVSFLANPRTFDQQFLNVGTHISRGGALHRVWKWTNPTTLTPTFGTYYDYQSSGATDGEALSENVALNETGDGVSPLDATGRQIMTYRVGSVLQPADFSALKLPTSNPSSWDDENDE